MRVASSNFFSNALDTSPCGSIFCKRKTANFSIVTYQSFKQYPDKKLDIMNPISKIRASTFDLCVTNCSRVFHCTSANFNQVLKEENCELLSENAYESQADLKNFQRWNHATTYVSMLSYLFDLCFFAL